MKYVLSLLVISIFLFACTQQAEKQESTPQTPAQETEIATPDTLSTKDTAVMALVEKAVALVLEEGTTDDGLRKVFDRFEDPQGDFVDGDLYLFVYNLEGTVIAHEAQPQLIGKNLIEKVDANGVKMIAEMVQIAKEEGSGWISYLWPYPGTGEIKPKRAYIARPGSMEMFIGCGYYAE